MKKFLFALTAASLVFGTGAQAKTEGPNPIAEKGEAKLAKMLEGRVAGKPMTCIPEQDSNRLQVIDQTAVVYDGGNTVYVARPRDPRSLNANDILIIDRRTSQLCSQDVIKTVDRTSGFMTGIIFLNDFTPYTRKR